MERNNPFVRLAFPTYDIAVKRQDDQNFIFDSIRRKWIVCTPEEWVRQNLILFLINEYQFPRNLISIEKSLNIANRQYRFDALVCDTDFKPFMIVECKAPTVRLTQAVCDQIWQYNYKVEAPYFLITNGFMFLAGRYSKSNGVELFHQMKSYHELKSER